jgi:hypothetical protein
VERRERRLKIEGGLSNPSATLICGMARVLLRLRRNWTGENKRLERPPMWFLTTMGRRVS